MEAIRPYVECVDKILWRIGYKNIVIGGIIGTATLAWLIMPQTQKNYYGYRFFKRSKPTRFVYDHPY